MNTTTFNITIDQLSCKNSGTQKHIYITGHLYQYRVHIKMNTEFNTNNIFCINIYLEIPTAMNIPQWGNTYQHKAMHCVLHDYHLHMDQTFIQTCQAPNPDLILIAQEINKALNKRSNTVFAQRKEYIQTLLLHTIQHAHPHIIERCVGGIGYRTSPTSNYTILWPDTIKLTPWYSSSMLSYNTNKGRWEPFPDIKEFIKNLQRHPIHISEHQLIAHLRAAIADGIPNIPYHLQST